MSDFFINFNGGFCDVPEKHAPWFYYNTSSVWIARLDLNQVIFQSIFQRLFVHNIPHFRFAREKRKNIVRF